MKKLITKTGLSIAYSYTYSFTNPVFLLLPSFGVSVMVSYNIMSCHVIISCHTSRHITHHPCRNTVRCIIRVWIMYASSLLPSSSPSSSIILVKMMY